MDIPTLERAAETLLAPPNLVSADDRRQAEYFFQDLKKNVNIEMVMQIMQQTQNPFVLYQMGQAVGELVLRDWSLLEQNVVEQSYKTILEFVAAHENLESFVVAEFLRSAAMIVKRGILDSRTGDPENLFRFIHDALNNQSPRLQSLGCRFISSLIEQFSSAWRNSKFSITWDFHLKAKTEFENRGLRRLLEISLTTLHALSNQDDILSNEFTRRLCEKFLEVAENVLSWNFSSRLFRRFLSINNSTNAFRPPASWKDLIANEEFYLLFFKLHSKIRINEELCTRSLNCLTQLASLTGDCLPVSDIEASTLYVTHYVSNLLDLFSSGPSPWEVNHLCTIINRLFLYRPLGAIIRMEATIRSRFFGFLTDYTLHLTREAMNKAIGHAEHNDHASLALIYDSFVVLLKGRWRSSVTSEGEEELVDNELIKRPTWLMVQEFVRCVLAPPLGLRPSSCDEEEGEDSEDRLLFNDLFIPLAHMICYSVNEFMPTMSNMLNSSLKKLTQIASGAADVSLLPNWQEDQHWLMLFLANSVVGEEMDGSCHVAAEVFENTIALLKAKQADFNEDTKKQYLTMCIEAPTQDRSALVNNVDPFVVLTGELLAWASLEHDLFSNAVREMVSPELCRSTFFALKRFLNAASNIIEFEGATPNQLPLLPQDEQFSQVIVRFVIRKVFNIFSNFGGEEKLCKDAIDCLVGLIESHAAVIASSPELFEHLGSLDIAKIPNRASLMKALVLIGAAANNSSLQENMFNLILAPLSTRFTTTASWPSSNEVDSQLVDLLQCFDGVAKASQSHSALVLFRFLQPVLVECASLMRSRAHEPTVIGAVLELLLDTTTKVSIYVEDEADSNQLYQALLQIVDVYRTDQVKRFVDLKKDDDDKANDLVFFIDILSNVLSKDILSSKEDGVSTGAKVALASLEMLLSIMSEQMLELPDVAVRFYRLILYLVEFSPEAMGEMSADLMGSLCECIKLGISGKFGNEITSTSLESLSEIANYSSQLSNRPNVPPALVAQFHQCLPLVFETCLENTCETSIYSEACGCLWALISFDMQQFDVFVSELLAKKSNQAAAEVLRQAFKEMVPETIMGTRREKIAFRNKFDSFLTKIQGLLSYN